MGTMPTFWPSAAIKRTWGAAISSLTRFFLSETITQSSYLFGAAPRDVDCQARPKLSDRHRA